MKINLKQIFFNSRVPLLALFMLGTIVDTARSDSSWENTVSFIDNQDSTLPYSVEYDGEPVCLDDTKNVASPLGWASKDCKKISASFYLAPVTDVGCSPAPASLTAYSSATEKSCKGVLKKSEMKDVIDCCGIFTGKFWVASYEFDGNCFRSTTPDDYETGMPFISVLLPTEKYESISYIKKSDFKKPDAATLEKMIPSGSVAQRRYVEKNDYFSNDYFNKEANIFAWQNGQLRVYGPEREVIYETRELEIDSSSCLIYGDAFLSVLRCPKTRRTETLPIGDPGDRREFVQYFKKSDTKNFINFYANLLFHQREEYDERSGLEQVILKYTTKNTNDRDPATYYVMDNGKVFSEHTAALRANNAGDFELQRRSEALYYGECDCDPNICTFP